jgi:hypothetical protein
MIRSTFNERRLARRNGFVLLSVIFAMTVMSILALAALTTAGDEFRASRALRESGAALYVAEAGLNEVLPACTDTLYGSLTPGDSVDLGSRTLPNGSTYQAMLRRTDRGTGQLMFLLTVRGRGARGLAGQRELHLVLRRPNLLPSTAFTIGGNIRANSEMNIEGACGGMHVNGWLDQNGTVVVDGDLSLTDSLIGNGAIEDTLGNPVIVTEGADSVELPQLDPMDYCGEADYILRGGYVITVGSPLDSTELLGPKVLGWTYDHSQDVYTVDTSVGVPGTVCTLGNVKVMGKTIPPLPLSVLATGSVEVGNSLITADHSDGLLIVAGGDVVMNGIGEVGVDNFSGLIYAGSQCELNGNAILGGQLVCRDGPDPVGARDLTTDNAIAGGPTIRFDCITTLIANALTPLRRRAWSQSF